MPLNARRPRRGPPERLAAWVVTGPLGHLYSAVADLAVFFARSMAEHLRRRLGAGGWLDRVHGRV